MLQEFDVPYINVDGGPQAVYQVPGGGQMFRQYILSQRVLEADALVDVQKMKNHAFMGITLTLKNLFGLMTQPPAGKPRHYFHHLVRMPYMLADLGQLFDPALNVIDGLVGQAGMEWGRGDGLARVANTLVAGDHPVATDAVGAHLMGHDPMSDWLAEPFHRDRNPLVVAAEGGYGTVDLDAIDYTSEVDPQPEGTFFAVMTDSLETVISWRRTMCEQALYYRDHMAEFTSKYAGEFILLQDNEVRWHDTDGHIGSAGANWQATTPTMRCFSNTSIRKRPRARSTWSMSRPLLTCGRSTRSARLNVRPCTRWTGSKCADGHRFSRACS